MHAALLTFLLVTGAPPQPATEGTIDAAVAEVVADTPDAGCPDAGRDRRACALWRSLWGWVIPISHTGYAPGTLRDPSYSWYKHPYLAFRGNYYLEGYDYLRQFDYQWHPAQCPLPARFAAGGRPPRSEEIPAPPAVLSGTARAGRNDSTPTAGRTAERR